MRGRRQPDPLKRGTRTQSPETTVERTVRTEPQNDPIRWPDGGEGATCPPAQVHARSRGRRAKGGGPGLSSGLRCRGAGPSDVRKAKASGTNYMTREREGRGKFFLSVFQMIGHLMVGRLQRALRHKF